MNISELRFQAALRGDSIYNRLPNSLLPLESTDKPANKDEFLRDLYNDIRTGRYFPSLPRGYIIQDKHKGVARIIPVFTYRDSCVYYLCIKEIEEHIAVNRVEGTYGGWSMGNPIRVLEEAETRPRLDVIGNAQGDPLDFDGYYIPGSINPYKWVENYRTFQKYAFEWSRQENLNFFIKFDIANFYDSINLNVLERKIRARVPRDKTDIVDLLFVFLRNWNREFEGYNAKTVGIPQDDIGDCSRMLANFYLLDHDEFMSDLCTKAAGGGRYLRYSDDQIVMTETAIEARRLLIRASQELHELGLNINSGKVEEFKTRDDFDFYWAFDLFALLAEIEDREQINRAAKQFIERLGNTTDSGKTRPWRSNSVRNRLISIGLDKIEQPTKAEILKTITLGRSIMDIPSFGFERIHRALGKEERAELIDAIELYIPEAHHNSFLFNVLRFYGKCCKGTATEHIAKRLRELTLD